MDFHDFVGWRVVAGRTWNLPRVVSFHPEEGLIIPVSGLDEVGNLREKAAL